MSHQEESYLYNPGSIDMVPPYYEKEDSLEDQLWDKLVVFGGSYFGVETKEEFQTDIENNIMKDPSRPQVLVTLALGPGEGKTLSTLQFMRKLTGPESTVQSIAQADNRPVVNSILPWGRAFNHIPEHLRVRNVNYTNSPFREKKREELALASDILAYRLRGTLDPDTPYNQQLKNSGAMQFAIVDTLTTGIIYDGKEIGFLRFFTQLQDLVRHQGIFEGLDYDTKIVAIAADPEIYYKAKKTRALLLKNSTPEALEEAGLIPDVDNPELTGEYVEENATPAEMELLRHEGNIFISKLCRKGILDRNFKGYYTVNSAYSFKYRPQDRTQFIGQNLLPWYIRDMIGAESEDVIILHNQDALEKIKVHLSLSHRRPLIETDSSLFDHIPETPN